MAKEDLDWGHEVDIEPSEGNDAEEEAPADPATAPLNPIEEGAPPGEEADPQPDEPATEPDGGEDGEEWVGDAPGIQEKVARALSRKPEAAGETPSLPPWREGSRPPRGTIPPQSGSRQRAAPPPPWDPTHPPGRIPKGSKDAQRARMGLSSSSIAGGPDAPRAYPALGSNDDEVRAQLTEAPRIAAEARAQAEAAQAALARLESEVLPKPTPTRGQAAVARLEAEVLRAPPAETLPAGGGTARDRSRSAMAKRQAGRTKPTLTARAKTPSAVPAQPWLPTLPKPPPGIAPPSLPKAQLPPGKARQPPIGAPPPQASAPEEEYELVEDESPSVSPKAELRPAPAKQSPIGAPPPRVPDLELDDDAPGVGVHYPPVGGVCLATTIGRNQHQRCPFRHRRHG